MYRASTSSVTSQPPVAQAQLLAERSPERSVQFAGEAAALAERYGMARVGEQARALAG